MKSWIYYYIVHVFPRVFHNIKYSIYLWIKLLQGDTSDYDIYSKEERYELLYLDFWYSLEEGVLDKEFFEYLLQLSKQAETGKVTKFLG